jgi:hypothetical protein
MEEQPVILSRITRVLNIGCDLAVARRQGCGLRADGRGDLGPPVSRGRRFGQGADRGSRRGRA